MKIEIIMHGKIADKSYKVLIDNYLSRCARRLPTKILYCKNTEQMNRMIENKTNVVALDEHSETKDTMSFCNWLSKIINSGATSLTFCLGPANGLDETTKKHADSLLSLSPMTMNHQLALLVLTEQLYRSISIQFNEPYHKD